MMSDYLKFALVAPPAAMNRKQAALHIGVCVATWDKLVAGGIMPRPHHLLGLYRYSRTEIEAALHVAPIRDDEVPTGMLRAEDM